MWRRTGTSALLFFAAACSEAATDPGVTLATVTVDTVSDLPDCDAPNEGEVRYVAERDKLYACTDSRWRAVSLKGQRGANGKRGPRGPEGLSSLIRSVALDQSSTECPGVGGVRIETGIDLNDNAVLDADEVQPPSAAICHGQKGNEEGAPGHNALVLTSTEPPGDNCKNGGVRIDSGTDTNDDGVLDTSGATGDSLQPPSYVCNATSVATTVEPAGEICHHGGQRLDIGADLDGDGTLLGDEITSTSYFCDALKFVAIHTGDDHTCGLVSDGTVRCWGNNNGGAFGRARPEDSFVPITVYGLTDAVAISVGPSHSCAVLRDGHAVCWGSNYDGQLGNESPDGDYMPSSVMQADGSALSEVVAISAGGSHSCAVLVGGRLLCWGRNLDGQLGDGTTDGRFWAAPVLAADSGAADQELTDVSAVSVGSSHTCAVVSGNALCWGLNAGRQLGTGDQTDSTRPRRVVEPDGSDLLDVSAVSANEDQTCAIANGRARCWGYNEFGALGDNITQPSTVFGEWGLPLADVTSISTAYYASCAVASEHGSSNVFCWGANGHGQLGNGRRQSNHRATAVVGFHRAETVTIGTRHACALPLSGRPLCWGTNANGELGNASYEPSDTAVPVVMP